jgi:hypothetical protein
MNDLNYNQIFKNILKVSGNELSRFEQFSLIIHAIFLRNNCKYCEEEKYLEPDWNREYDKSFFDYVLKGQENEVKIKVELKKDTLDENKIIIQINCDSTISQNNKLSINSSIDLREDICKKIDFEDLDSTIQDLEQFIREKIFKEIQKLLKTQNGSSASNLLESNINMNTRINQTLNYGGEVDPNRYLMGNITGGGYNPMPNPYFSTGGGSVGGNLVGPTSDIFTGHMFPQPMSGIHPIIRYDPIGPFGTFGAPDKKNDNKKYDPLFGGNPFDGTFPNINKKPGQGPFGGGPGPFGGGFGGGMGGNPWG